MKEQTQSRLISGKVTLSVSWISCRNIIVACLNFFILKTPELKCRRTRLNVFCGIATFLKTPQIKVRSHVYDLMRGGRLGSGSFAMLGPFHSRVCGTVNTPPKNENDRHHRLFAPVHNTFLKLQRRSILPNGRRSWRNSSCCVIVELQTDGLRLPRPRVSWIHFYSKPSGCIIYCSHTWSQRPATESRNCSKSYSYLKIASSSSSS